MMYNRPFEAHVNDSTKKWLLENIYLEDSKLEFWIEYYDISIDNGTTLSTDRWTASVLWEELNKHNPEIAIEYIERL